MIDLGDRPYGHPERQPPGQPVPGRDRPGTRTSHPVRPQGHRARVLPDLGMGADRQAAQQSRHFAPGTVLTHWDFYHSVTTLDRS